jgi:hydrogenase maturation protein HypF
MVSARTIRVRGVVQGVGFRPFVFRLAQTHALNGWVQNAEEGVEIHLEGPEPRLETFLRQLSADPPPAACIAEIEVQPAEPSGINEFAIHESRRHDRLTARISPDLPVCDACLTELFDPTNRCYLFPYINCTDCGPRYSIIRELPYDRFKTTMKDWSLCTRCAEQYDDAADRRFHAQPVACPICGPHYLLRVGAKVIQPDGKAIDQAVELLREGKILAVKGLGGYHLACDASNAQAVWALRQRKYRKEKPFALMVGSLEIARGLIELSEAAETLIQSSSRPILLATAKIQLEGVAPENGELGVMLPYTPLHHLLFAQGAPAVLVMTSANRSNEPLAYSDEDALSRLSGIADGFLIGQRPIARRVDDSVARVGPFGPVILRRARGYAPSAAATIPTEVPVLAVGADLKNAITLVVKSQAFVSQHIGDLDQYSAFQAFEETIQNLISMYEVPWDQLLIAHDAHPQYHSTLHALKLPGREKRAVQHHRAHLASILAERGAWEKRVVGVSCDGTGYGDDGAIWGGEVFVGSVLDGLDRVAHLRYAALPGGDTAALNPVQAAAGFLAQWNPIPDLTKAPFEFPERFQQGLRLVRQKLRTFPTSSLGRLFDAAAALLGFKRDVSFEGQAAIWLEHLARTSSTENLYPFPFADSQLDYQPLLQALIEDRRRGREVSEIARAFHKSVAHGLFSAAQAIAQARDLDTVLLSGGVFQNDLLLEDLRTLLTSVRLKVWVNQKVPPNDGGISLGQAALAAFA